MDISLVVIGKVYPKQNEAFRLSNQNEQGVHCNIATQVSDPSKSILGWYH
jgi:hypothetical protein